MKKRISIEHPRSGESVPVFFTERGGVLNGIHPVKPSAWTPGRVTWAIRHNGQRHGTVPAGSIVSLDVVEKKGWVPMLEVELDFIPD